jgi:4-hydroxybenzoate polyprenyltransferase
VTSRLRALRVVHPFPSFVNAALVLALALIADGGPIRAVALSGAMLLLQFAIGIANDIADRDLDRATKPWKPVASGAVSLGAASIGLAAVVAGGLVTAVAFGPLVAALWLAMLACGLAYDFRLKPTPWAWVCYALAFALLPIYAWEGAAGSMPPRAEFLIPVAALAGPALQIANGLIDLETDARAGLPTLVTRLGRRPALILMGTLLALIYAAAWGSLAVNGPASSRLAVAAATALAALSVGLSAWDSPRARAGGWTGQVLAIALLATGWLAAI